MLRPILTSILLGTLIQSLVFEQVEAQQEVPPIIAYQGYLTDDDGAPITGSPSMILELYDQEIGDESIWREERGEVIVSEGIFTVQLGEFQSLDEIAFDKPLWLGIRVGSNEFATRIPLESVPYALGMRGMRAVPEDDDTQGYTLSMIGGHPLNNIGEDVLGATISGGGFANFPNKVEASLGTIGGGAGHSVIGDIGGTVGGGVSNQVAGDYASVSGGVQNESRGDYATVPGGRGNIASGEYTTVLGGRENLASGDYALAAGYRARALNDGSFVWADFFNVDDPEFASTGTRQFLIRARNGVGIGTNTPRSQLHVSGSSLDIHQESFAGETIVVEDDEPVVGLYGTFDAQNRPGIVMGGVDGNGDLVDKWSITREFFAGNRLLFAYGLNAGPDDNNTALSLSPDGAVAETFTSSDDLGGTGTPLPGAHYRDNVVYAWATVGLDGKATSSYGCTVTKLTGSGQYRVEFKRELPNGASAVVTVQTVNDPVIATAVTNANNAQVATKVFDGNVFKAADYGFYIQVVGRP